MLITIDFSIQSISTDEDFTIKVGQIGNVKQEINGIFYIHHILIISFSFQTGRQFHSIIYHQRKR